MRFDMTVAKTILGQLGGSRFVVMTGSRNFVGGKNYLQFRIGKNKTSCNTVTITLNSLDLYDVRFSRTAKSRGHLSNKTQKEYENIYAECLPSVFTEYTGLYTFL